MKLLRLRGENLASLARRFELSFADGALHGAGLFAITGETGSGKSTLLDAMCLALYGSYPRVDFTGSESVVDPGGEEVRSNDARNILRRGMGLGWAEIDFEARDGHEYQARWEARRAHGKGSGKLQAEKRSLKRLHDGVTVADRTTEVGKKVVELTGLNFEQFQRTCLLAQGKFDAFLIAKENERGELLERITGTAIYSKISQMVFARAGERKGEWEKLLTAWQALKAMSAEERAAVEAQVREASERVRLAEGKITSLDEQLGRWAALAKAEGEETAAKGRKEAAEGSWALEEESRKKLAAWDRAQELAGVFQARKSAAAASKTAQDDLGKARRNYDQAILAEAQAKDQLNGAMQAWQKAAEAVRGFVEDWKLAGQLDAAIATAAGEYQRLSEEVSRKKTAQAAAVDRLEKLQKDQSDSQKELEGVSDWLRGQAGRVELAGQFGMVQGLLESRRKLQEGRKAPVAAKLLDVVGQLEEVELQLSRVDEAELHRRAGLGVVAAALQEEKKLVGGLGESAQVKVAAEQELRMSEEALARTTQSIALAEARLGEAGKLSERAELSAAQAAEELRGRLEDGVACPVCGSTEHPYAHEHGAWAEVALEMRRRKGEIEGELALLGTERDAAFEGKAKAQERIAAASKRMGEAEAALLEVRGKIPAEFAGMEAEVLAEQSKEASRQLQGLSKLREEQARLLGWRSDLEKLGENTMRISAFVEGFGVSLTELDGGHERWARELKRRVDEVVEKGKEEKKIADFLARIAVEVGQARATVDAGGKALEELEGALQEKAVALDGLRGQRLQLLGGEALQPHEQRHRDAEEKARGEQERLSGDFAAKGGARSGAEARRSEDEEKARLAGEALARQEGLFRAECERVGFGESEAEGLLAIGGMTAERERLQGVQQKLDSAGEALRERSLAAVKAREACAGLMAAEELRVERQEQVGLRNEAQTAIGGARERLAADDLVLAAAKEARTKVDAAEAKYKVWQEMNEAIGSAQGDKFRKFVQSVTLDHLVQLANHHIRGFAPRYRLGRAGAGEQLALQVVDTDMGEAVRPTATLSGGERFLTSLGLALALSGLEGKESFVDTLFIDEGFGTLDAESLDLVMSILQQLPSMGRRVGVISHVAAMREQIPVQVRVVKRGAGRSEVEIWDGGTRLGGMG